MFRYPLLHFVGFGLLSSVVVLGTLVAAQTLQLVGTHGVAGQNSLLTVDDDDMIAAVHVGGVGDLVLAAQQGGDSSSGTAQGLAGSIDDIPFTLNRSGFSHSSAHVLFLRFDF